MTEQGINREIRARRLRVLPKRNTLKPEGSILTLPSNGCSRTEKSPLKRALLPYGKTHLRLPR
jgi:hypothetical protein